MSDPVEQFGPLGEQLYQAGWQHTGDMQGQPKPLYRREDAVMPEPSVCYQCGRTTADVPRSKYCGAGNDKDYGHRWLKIGDLTPKQFDEFNSRRPAIEKYIAEVRTIENRAATPSPLSIRQRLAASFEGTTQGEYGVSGDMVVTPPNEVRSALIEKGEFPFTCRRVGRFESSHYTPEPENLANAAFFALAHNEAPSILAALDELARLREENADLKTQVSSDGVRMGLVESLQQKRDELATAKARLLVSEKCPEAIDCDRIRQEIDAYESGDQRGISDYATAKARGRQIVTLLDANRELTRQVERLRGNKDDARHALSRLLEWDMLDKAADGPYWRAVIVDALERSK